MRTIPRTERRSRLSTLTIPATILGATLATATSLWALPADVAPRDPNDLTRRVLEARARQMLRTDEPNPADIIRERIERANAERPPVPDVVLPPPHQVVPPPPQPADPDPNTLFNTAPADAVAPDDSQADAFRPDPAPRTRTYAIQPGDTLGEIAMEQLGTVKRLPDILKLNPDLDPRKLRVGQEITLPILGADNKARGPLSPGAPAPTSTTTASHRPAPATPVPTTPTRTITVEKGETLGHISQRVYGTVKHWQHILNANKDTLSDPKKLRVGMTLRIPPKPE